MKLITLLFLSFFSHALLANTFGSLKGSIHDDITNQPIAGANILIQNLTLQTDATGSFEIAQLPVGKYNAIVEKAGYQMKIIPLSIQANEIEKMIISLKINALSLPEVLIKSDRAMSAASSRVINALDFQLRNLNSAQDMLRIVPGLITAQHAGGGKAEQIFLRGFDVDHGTDVAAFVDGIPVNMPSHGHGQGYLDMHFLIPEAVKTIDVFKGTYFADLGDFATAGAIKFKTLDVLDKNIAQLEVGSVPSQRGFANSRGLLMYQLPLAKNNISSYVASEYIFAPSYFDASQNFKRLNVLSKSKFHLTEKSAITFLASHFNSSWDASGQIPQRALDAGLISRFGAIDNREGGNTARQNISLTHTYIAENQSFESQFYYSKYDFNLYSNFTFFKNDTLNGDMINQRDNRNVMGLNTKYVFNTGKNKVSVGGGMRYDVIENSLDNTSNRQFSTAISSANIKETAMNIYIKDEYELSPKLKAEVGVRFNYFNFEVQDNIPTDAFYLNYSGKNHQTQLAPKFNLTYSLSDNYKFYFNTGKGFHSNDARAVVQDNSGLHNLPKAWGGEIGFQAKPLSKIVFSAALWGLTLDNELVFIGDEGTTEDAGASRRIGLDLGIRATLTPWLYFDADVNFSKGRLVEKPFGKILETDNLIPLAPNFTSTGGLTWRLSQGIEGTLRHRYIGNRAANENNSVIAKGYNVLDFNCFYKKDRYKIGFTVENFFNIKWNEAQFDTESQLRNETQPVSELHFTPGTPFSAKLVFGVFF
jgi:outer membrane receptor for Fe3+-dicitrate